MRLTLGLERSTLETEFLKVTEENRVAAWGKMPGSVAWLPHTPPSSGKPRVRFYFVVYDRCVSVE